MKCSNVVVGKDNEKNAPIGLRLIKLLNKACIR